MNISIKSMPSSLVCSIAKDHAYNIADIIMYSNKSKLRNTIEIIKQVVKGLFLTLLSLPVDFFFIPIAFTAKKIYDKKTENIEKNKFFNIEVAERWSGKKGENEVSAEDSKILMKNPEAFGLKKIKIPIAKCDHLQMKEEDLPEIVKLANKYTIHVPYVFSEITSRYFGSMYKDTYVFHPNHDGTHAARQLRFVEAIFELIEKKGTSQSKAILKRLTDEEKLNLKLAAYFCRAGRVDESGWENKTPPDKIYKVRSANIYDRYARQLYSTELSDSNLRDKANRMIEWTNHIQINSSTYSDKYFSEMTEKDKLCRDILQLSHKIEQIRCASAEKINNHELPFINKFLSNFLGVDEQTAESTYWPILLEFAKKVSDSTGVGRCFDKVPFNKKLFLTCSFNGDTCLEIVRKVEFKV